MSTSSSWHEKLLGGFRRTSDRLVGNLAGLGGARLDEPTLDEIEEALIASDLGPETAGHIRQRLAEGTFERNMEVLGLRLVEAIERDFTPAQRRVGELAAIPANALSEISSTHMKGSYMYANELANALAGANRDGEEARREERLRIWGYA